MKTSFRRQDVNFLLGAFAGAGVFAALWLAFGDYSGWTIVCSALSGIAAAGFLNEGAAARHDPQIHGRLHRS